MRAILPAEGSNGPGLPLLGDLPDPVAGPGEVLVAVAAAGLNRADLLQLRGGYPPPRGESEVPGLECAGRVVAVGEGAGGWRGGERVMALLGGGGQATRVAVPVGQLMPIPEGMSYVEAAAVPEAGLTGWTNLVAEGRLERGEAVLITGATGGVGSFAAQLARELGARVLATARDPARLERLRDFGIDGLCPAGADLSDRVREKTGGRGADLVLDLIGGAALPGHLASLRAGGRLVLLGALGGTHVEIDAGAILRRRLTLIGSLLRSRPRPEKARLVSAFADFALPRLASGRLRPVVDRVFPFERAADAYSALAAGGVFGKLILEIPA